MVQNTNNGNKIISEVHKKSVLQISLSFNDQNLQGHLKTEVFSLLIKKSAFRVLRNCFMVLSVRLHGPVRPVRTTARTCIECLYDCTKSLYGPAIWPANPCWSPCYCLISSFLGVFLGPFRCVSLPFDQTVFK